MFSRISSRQASNSLFCGRPDFLRFSSFRIGAFSVGGDEGRGKDSILCGSGNLFSFLCPSFFICVGFSVAVEPVDGKAAVGFSDDGWADESPSWGTGLSRMMYSLALNFPALSVLWRRKTYPAFSSSTTAARMASFPSALMRASPANHLSLGNGVANGYQAGAHVCVQGSASVRMGNGDVIAKRGTVS